MSKKLYIGNLSYNTTEDTLRKTFGEDLVTSVILPSDHSGRPKGFGFVEISDDEAAEKLIQEKNGMDLDGRSIVVNEARPREDRPQGQSGYRRDNRDSNRGQWANR